MRGDGLFGETPHGSQRLVGIRNLSGVVLDQKTVAAGLTDGLKQSKASRPLAMRISERRLVAQPKAYADLSSTGVDDARSLDDEPLFFAGGRSDKEIAGFRDRQSLAGFR